MEHHTSTAVGGRSLLFLPPFGRTKRLEHNTYRGPSIYYVSKRTGWVGSENGYSLLKFSTIYADEGWVRESPNKFLRNVGMVFYNKIVSTPDDR